MINLEIIKDLIDQIPEIETLFTTETYTMVTWYNRETRSRMDSGMNLKTIFKNPRFLKWKEQLYFELQKIENDRFITDILDLLSNFSGLGDQTRFAKLSSKLYVLKDHLDNYKEDADKIQIEDDERLPEKEICEKILRALSKLQRNSYYNADCNEDTMNDYMRDILDEHYITKDQTRQGESESGKNAGEVDIQICCDGLPIVMIEGIKVSSVEKERLNNHINKLLTKYDPNGCPYAFLIIYTTIKSFESGYQNLFDYFQRYEYPFPRETNLEDIDTGYGELKHAQIILNRNNLRTRVHIWAVHIN